MLTRLPERFHVQIKRLCISMFDSDLSVTSSELLAQIFLEDADTLQGQRDVRFSRQSKDTSLPASLITVLANVLIPYPKQHS